MLSGERRILIVHSDPTRFGALGNLLLKARVEMRHVLPTNDAFVVAEAWMPDVVVLGADLGPRRSVLGYLRRFKSIFERSSTKFIVTGKNVSKELLESLVAAGMDDFVLDPFQARLLMLRLRYQMQERESFSPEDLQTEPTQIAAGFDLVYGCQAILADTIKMEKGLLQVAQKVAELSLSTRVNVFGVSEAFAADARILASSDGRGVKPGRVKLENYPEVRESLLTGNILFIKDVARNPLTEGVKRRVRSIEIDSILVFPLRAQGMIWGTLNIRLKSREGYQVSKRHIKTFYMVALALGSRMAQRDLFK